MTAPTPYTGPGCCRAADDSDGNAHDHPVGAGVEIAGPAEASVMSAAALELIALATGGVATVEASAEFDDTPPAATGPERDEALRMLAETRQQRDELRGALAAALKDDAIEQGYASGHDDARRLVQAHIDDGEAGDWSMSVMEALRAVAEDLDGDRTAAVGVGRWLELVWKQAIEDRDAAWRALDSLGIDPRHAEAGAQRFLAAVDQMGAAK